MTMMTAEAGLSQDLDDILDKAGNPRFVEWVDKLSDTVPGLGLGFLRAYRFPDGTTKYLWTEESETGIEDHVWLTLEEVIEWREENARQDRLK